MDPSGVGTSAPSSRLLVGLPEGTPQRKFVDIKQLGEEVTRQRGKCCQDIYSTSPFLVISDIPTNICEQLENHSEQLGKVHISADLKDKILLIETMVSLKHELIAREVEFKIKRKAENMGIVLLSGGGTTVQSGNYVKQPDCSFFPKPAHLRTWPTLVVEVGWSETEQKLAVDAQGWLEAQGSQTNLVLTIKVERACQKITVRMWEKREPRRATRSSQISAVATQQTEITYSNGSTTVTGEIQLPFDQVFDRPPNPNKPIERDITLSRQDLIDIAEEGWEAHGFFG